MTPRTLTVSCSAWTAVGRPCSRPRDHRIVATDLEHVLVFGAMGFLKPDMPVVDFAEWVKGTRSEKIRPMAEHWAEVGFGTPVVMHLFYVVKILLYILGGWLLPLATNGIDGFTNVGQWWTEPIVFEKVVLYT